MGEEFIFNPEVISNEEVFSRIPDFTKKIEKNILEETNYYLSKLSNSPLDALKKANLEIIANFCNNNKKEFISTLDNLDIKLS